MKVRKEIQKAPDFTAERSLIGADSGAVAGVDEAGRGPWAGPVVAAAVILAEETVPKGLRDSKLLSAAQRERLFDTIRETAEVGVGIASVEDIDRLNVLQATFLAMKRAVEALRTAPGTALIDGNACPPLGRVRAVAVTGGDRLCPSIAAASIIAKVTRDRLMTELAESFPGYGWHANKGYGTREHSGALARLGVTPHHRRSFAPVRALLEDMGRNPQPS
jgi:ribonuclease HII